MRHSGRKRFRLHDTGHTAATLVLASGVVPLKVASARLGHSTTAVIADIYMHVLPMMDRTAANVVAAILA